MNVEVIEKLDEVLSLPNNQSIDDYKLTRLTAPGENYGSIIMRLEVKISDKKTKEKQELDLVAKLLPPAGILRQVFNVQVTYRNEVALYKVIVPVLEEFQKQQGVSEVVDVFPKYYGSRLSLDPNSEVVDDGAVLILENLKPKGFTNVQRTIGFDLPSARLLVRNLAYFHSIPLALKLKNPDLFEKKIKPYLADFPFGDGPPSTQIEKDIIDIVSENPTCVLYIDRIKFFLKQKSLKTVHEPFATILHNDYWVNNMLLKFENGQPVANKMVDFQVIEYKCPCRDLMFFLFSSVQIVVLRQHLDELIDLYYESFIGKLEELKCDTTPFSRDAFDKQMELASKEAEFFHLVMMIFPINANAEDVKELSEMSQDDFMKKNKVTSTCFITGERTVGFDLPSARLLVRNLAYFHAIPLALKLKNPDLFEKKIKPYLVDFKSADGILAELQEDIINIVKEDPTCSLNIDRIKSILKQQTLKNVHEPFATILHNDYWVNNMLLKFENGQPVANKMVDFQVIEYKCPCRDLIFFLFSSVQIAILKQHLDELIDLYYESFIDKLEELKCDTTPFSRETFDKQMELAAKEAEYFHLSFMVFPINSSVEDVKELNEMSHDDFKNMNKAGSVCKERLIYITSEFIKRGWI